MELGSGTCARRLHLCWNSDLCKGMWRHRETSQRRFKAGFEAKLRSPVLDYAADLASALYVHEWWVFDTITCAVKSTDVWSALQSLNAKPSMFNYTVRVNELCADLHRTLGLASLFLTIAPGEYNFSYGRPLEHALTLFSRHNSGLAFLDVHHTVHVAMQVLEGYIAVVQVSTPQWENLESSD